MPAGAEKGKAATKTDWTINFTTIRRGAAPDGWKFVTVEPIMNTRETEKNEKGQRTTGSIPEGGGGQLVREVEMGR